jgi:hypothetical protein
MSKYIPKVGEVFLLDGMERTCVATGKYLVICENSNGNESFAHKDECKPIPPIPTKADVEREQLSGFFNDASNFGHSDEWLINKIQESSFTIPKKVKRSDVRSLVHEWSVKPCRLVVEICELLGDLVEQDEKGGAE